MKTINSQKKKIKKVVAMLLVISMLSMLISGEILAAEEKKLPEQEIILVLDFGEKCDLATRQQQSDVAEQIVRTLWKKNPDYRIAVSIWPLGNGDKMPLHYNGWLNSDEPQMLTDILSEYTYEQYDFTTTLYHAMMWAHQSYNKDKRVERKMVILSNGLPSESGPRYDGPYTDEDYEDSYTANCCYGYSRTIEQEGDRIYTVGCYNGVVQEQMTFARRFLTDVQNCGYYEAEDISSLVEELSDTAIQQPLSVNLTNSEHTDDLHDLAIIEIKVDIANDNDIPLTNVWVELDPGDVYDISYTGPDVSSELLRREKDFLTSRTEIRFNWVARVEKSQLQDSNYTFTVTVGSNRTVPVTKMHSVPVNIHSKTDNRLRFGTDTYRFSNFKHDILGLPAGHAWYMFQEDKQAILGGLPPALRSYIEEGIKKDGKNGHCYGMAASTIVDKMDVFDMAAIEGSDTLYGLENTRAVQSKICYWQLTQAMPGMKTAIQNFISLPTAMQLAEIEAEVREVKNGGVPVLLSYYGGLESKFSGAGHAVVAYDVEEGYFVSETTGKSYNRKVYIYDNNRPENNPSSIGWSNEEQCLFFNEGTDEWEIPIWEITSDHIDDRLQVSAGQLSEIAVQDYEAGRYNYQAELKSRNDTAIILRQDMLEGGLKWLIPGRKGSTITGPEDLLYYYDAGTEEDGQSALNVVLPNETEDYFISTESGNADMLEFTMLYDDICQTVTAEKASGAAVSPEGSVAITGNTGSFEITLADNRLTGQLFDTYSISGVKNKGNYSVENTEEGIFIIGDNLEGISVTGRNEFNEESIGLSTEQHSVQVNVEEGELAVFTDQDGDGICETDVTEKDYVVGDIDANQQINASDALMALRHSVKEINLKGSAFTRGDTTFDDDVDAQDALQILRYSVKEIDHFE